MKYIGIVGSRRRNTMDDFQLVYDEFFKHYETGDIIVSGGCPKGADRFAEIISYFGNGIESYKKSFIEAQINLPTFYSSGSVWESKIHMKIHYPDKSKLSENPKRWEFARINYDRNTLIADQSDILIACVAPDRKGGTEDTIKKFIKRSSFNKLFLV